MVLVHSPNLSFLKLDKLSKMKDLNQKEVGFQTTLRMGNQDKQINSSLTIRGRFRAKVINNKLDLINIISIWMQRSSLHQLKTIMVFQSKVGV